MQVQEAPKTRVQELFGGSFRIVGFPTHLRDISDLVPISDNQEIFSDVDDDNPAYSGNQLIFEILEKTDKSDQDAAQFHFEDLVETQNGKDSQVLSVKHFNTSGDVSTVIPNLNITGSQIIVTLLKGVSKIFPTKKTVGGAERDFVTLELCLIRLKEPYDTDLLITLNVPDKFSDPDEEGDLQGEPGSSKKYLEFVNKSEEVLVKQILGGFTIPSDQALKDLLGM